MKTSEPSPAVVRQIALNMRDKDFAEFSAVSFEDTRDGLADTLARLYGERNDVTVCSTDDGEPVCVGATVMARPNVVTLMFFATARFPEIALPVTRYIRRYLFPRLEKAGVHRIEAVSMAGYDEAHAWIRTLGLEQETKAMHGYGKGGEAFIQFSKVVNG